MTLQQIRYVITIAESGSFNKAAERLYVAQPSLSSAVQALEQELGIRIFSRTGRGITVTAEGQEFLQYARQLQLQQDLILEKYGKTAPRKQKFGVSAQHYSFAVKSFVETVKKLGTADYDFAIRETMTKEVISDVASGKSEIGILYVSDFNRTVLEKLFRSADLEFHPLVECRAYVYLYKDHPLAKQDSIRFEDLEPYPCLAFEQGDAESFYYSEEILSTAEYPRLIHAADRATMLNLMVGLNGYTLCSGIICSELNGEDYRAIPLSGVQNLPDSRMTVGYLTKKNLLPSPVAELYIRELQAYLQDR